MSETTLLDACSGVPVKITGLAAEPAMCQRLREMGLCEAAHVRKIAANGALICCLDDSKFVLSEHLAKSIFVEPVPSPEVSSA